MQLVAVSVSLAFVSTCRTYLSFSIGASVIYRYLRDTYVRNTEPVTGLQGAKFLG